MIKSDADTAGRAEAGLQTQGTAPSAPQPAFPLGLAFRHILGMRVDCTDYADAVERIGAWAAAGASCYVCAANVHMVMVAYDDAGFARVVDEAALVTADGMPLVWALRRLGLPEAGRVYGPDLTLHVCAAAAERGLPVALYGGTPDVLEDVSAFLMGRFPGLRIACRIAPPFRPLTAEEDDRYTAEIVGSGARIVLVGIGCPKQERWMAAHRGRVPAVMIGVGAAFDFFAGRVRQAPAWMQGLCLEWLFRLLMEPRRLWKRYARHNPRFAALFLRQLARRGVGAIPPSITPPGPTGAPAPELPAANVTSSVPSPPEHPTRARKNSAVSKTQIS